jgi:hypothetical protein
LPNMFEGNNNNNSGMGGMGGYMWKS